MKEWLNSPAFGILVSIMAYEAGLLLYKRTKLILLHPLLIAIALVIGLLKVFNISLDTFDAGGNVISFFLGPATVVLAVPLYKQVNRLKEDMLPILSGIAAGCIAAVTSVCLLSRIFGLQDQLIRSLIPKSVTTPIGMEISRMIGGVPSITVAAIILTGITGAVAGPFILRAARIKDPTAAGIALGTSSHGIGTSRAIELGELQGAMSGLSIGLAGLLTVFLAPIAARLLG